MLVVRERCLRTIPKTKVDAIAWWIDSDATTYVCKDRCWFKTFEPVEDGYVLYMGDGKGSVALEFNSGKTVYESDKYILSKCGVFLGFGYYNNGMFMLNLNKVPDDSDYVYMSSSSVVNSSLLHTRLGHVHYKRMRKMSKDDLIPAIDENLEKCTTCMLTNITRQPFNSITRKSIILELIHSDLYDFHATPSLGNKKYAITFIDDASRVVEPWLGYLIQKRKTLGAKGIDCIFVGYAKHSKAYRFYVIEPNDSISVNSIIELKDAIFDENCFSSIPRQKDIIPNGQESQMDDHTDDDAAFWKEAIDDEIGSIMENNTWVLSDLPPVARITTIRLLLALEAIHNLVIHQMDVKTSFLNGDLDKEVYMKQSKGFVMPVISLRLNLTDQNQVDKTKKFLSSRFSMKDMGEANVILSIKIKRENKGIVITQSHYIEKILKMFNRKDCSSVSTLMDPVEKHKPNTGKPVDQLEYSRAIGCLMYAMTSTRPDIAYDVESYSDASWINHVEDSSSTSGWMFLLKGGVISLASKKQTCITSSTMESEFVALAAASKEA
nr:zinc finger, CCHC-type [Tanacetum cinerariifolium]